MCSLISRPSFSSSKETLIGTKYDKTKQKCEIVKEGFSSMNNNSVAYMSSKNPVCPWKNQPANVKPFSLADNYVRI